MSEPGLPARHFAGFAGRQPPNAAELVRSAVECVVDGSTAVEQPPGLTVAFGPSSGSSRSPQPRLCILAGELFDREALAETLGLSPETSDERLINAGFARWGEVVLRRVRTDACLLIWDCGTASGFIATDALGASSLFWCRVGGALAFATELRPLLELLPTQPGPDPVGVAHWLRRQASRPELTLFEGVHQLPAGHRLNIGPNAGGIDRYWQPSYEPPPAWDVNEANEHIRPAVRRAVERRLARQGITAILLSGGLDSASVAGVARSLREDGLRAYSAVFPDQPRLDESRWIDPLVQSLALPGVRLTPEPQGILVDALEFLRRWAVPPDGYSYWTAPLRERAAADGAAVMLTGDAGDEVFNSRLRLIGDRLRGGRPVGAYQLARGVPGLLFYPPPRMLARVVWEYGLTAAVPRLTTLSRVGPKRWTVETGWLRDETARILRDTVDTNAWKDLDGPRWWAEQAHHLTVRLQAHGQPAYNRRRGEEQGIMVRSPLLDFDLVRLALRCPPELGFNRTLSKPLLRAAVQGYVPDTVRLRPVKTAWDSFIVEGVHGPDRATIDWLLRDSNAEIRAYVKHETFVREMLDQAAPAGGMSAFFWALDLLRVAILECWLRHLSDPGFTDRLLDAGDLASRRYRLWRVEPRTASATRA